MLTLKAVIHCLWRFRSCRATAGLEFALVAPVMVTTLVCAFDLVQMLTVWRRMSAAALAMVEMATSVSVQPNSTNSITGSQAEIVNTVAFSYIPDWKSIHPSLYGISLSSITFFPDPANCTSSCTYVASTSWSASSSSDHGGTAQRRPCGRGAIQPVSSYAKPSLTTMPNAMFVSYGSATNRPSSVIVADLTYQFKPMLLGAVVGAFTIQASAYLPPRIGGVTQSVTYMPSTGIPDATANSSLQGYAKCL